MTKTVEFNVEAFEAADTAVLEVMGLNEEPLMFNGAPVTIEMYGPGSKENIRASAKLESANMARTFAALRNKQIKDAHEEQRQLVVEKLTACTKQLNNFPIEGGAAGLYSNPKLGYITNQAQKFIEDWGNFTKGSTKT